MGPVVSRGAGRRRRAPNLPSPAGSALTNAAFGRQPGTDRRLVDELPLGYPTREDYLAKVTECLLDLKRQRFLLDEDVTHDPRGLQGDVAFPAGSWRWGLAQRRLSTDGIGRRQRVRITAPELPFGGREQSDRFDAAACRT